MIQSNEAAPVQDLIARGEPLTHIFYEYEGEQSIHPETLINSGITLWHENVYSNEAHDNRGLWQLAETLLNERHKTPMYSWVEWLRYRITKGELVPETWDVHKPYPYKGLLISAIYFHEARRICAAGDSTRAWHIAAMAYYHLGLNTNSSTLKNTSRAAQMRHAARSEKIRMLVLEGLDIIASKGTAGSIAQAKDQVVDLLREKNKGVVRDWLNEFDTLVPEKTKGRTTGSQKNDVLDRIRNLLDAWSLPSGPYPEIAESFSRFNAKKPNVTRRVEQPATNEDVPLEETSACLRVVNLLNSGDVLSFEFSDVEDESDT